MSQFQGGWEGGQENPDTEGCTGYRKKDSRNKKEQRMNI